MVFSGLKVDQMPEWHTWLRNGALGCEMVHLDRNIFQVEKSQGFQGSMWVLEAPKCAIIVQIAHFGQQVKKHKKNT